MRASAARPERCQVSSGMPPMQTSSSSSYNVSVLVSLCFLCTKWNATHANIAILVAHIMYHSYVRGCLGFCNVNCLLQSFKTETSGMPAVQISLSLLQSLQLSFQSSIWIRCLLMYGVWCLYDVWFNHTCLNTHHTSSTWLQDTSTVTVTHVHWYMVIWIPIIHHRPSFKIHCQKQCFQLSWYKLPSSSQCSIVLTASQCWISIWIWWTIV